MAARGYAGPVARPLRTPPTPIHIDTRTVVLIGTAGWIVAAVVLGAAWTWVDSHGHSIWLWTCLTGAGLGLVGLPLIGKHRGEGRL